MKGLKSLLIVLCFLIFINLSLGTAIAYQTQNVVVIVLCGVRNTEFLLDPTHQYIPNIWNNLRPQGVINTNMQILVDPSTVCGLYAILSGTWTEFTNTNATLSQERNRLHLYHRLHDAKSQPPGCTLRR